jgi:hypothetical protein
MLPIALVVGIIYVFTETQKNRQVALDKGVDEDQLTLFAVLLWLYAFPPVASLLFVDAYNIWVALIFVCFYIPGTIMARRLSLKLGTGYDFQRKLGREYDKAMWLGFAGIGLVLFNWVFRGFQSLFRINQP